MQKIYNIGDGFVESALKDLPKHEIEQVVKLFAEPELRAIFHHLTTKSHSLLLGIAGLEGVSAETLEHVRVQTVTIASVFRAMIHNGDLYLSELGHPLLQPEQDKESAN